MNDFYGDILRGTAVTRFRGPYCGMRPRPWLWGLRGRRVGAWYAAVGEHRRIPNFQRMPRRIDPPDSRFGTGTFCYRWQGRSGEPRHVRNVAEPWTRSQRSAYATIARPRLLAGPRGFEVGG